MTQLEPPPVVEGMVGTTTTAGGGGHRRRWTMIAGGPWCDLARLAVLGSLFEMAIVIYYTASIIVVSFVFGQRYYSPDESSTREYWLSLIAVRYFLIGLLLAFALVLMIAVRVNSQRLLVVYTCKSLVVSFVAVGTVIADSLLIVGRRWPSSTESESDGLDRTTARTIMEEGEVEVTSSFCTRLERWYTLIDIGVNGAHALIELWFLTTSRALYVHLRRRGRQEQFVKHLQQATKMATFAALRCQRRSVKTKDQHRRGVIVITSDVDDDDEDTSMGGGEPICPSPSYIDQSTDDVNGNDQECGGGGASGLRV